VKNLDSIKPLVRIIELILVLIFFFHIFNGIRLWLENRAAKSAKYAVNGSAKDADLFSRTMIWSGSMVFIFLVIHLRTFWVSFNLGSPLAESHQYYEIVVQAFQNPVYSGLYIVAVILLGFHLNHGFQSAFQTFGWNNNKYFPLIRKAGFGYALIMSIGFASIPVYFLFFHGGK
jgi:succinate dehydrogenase / fumarate reductase cytochrome b subunit